MKIRINREKYYSHQCPPVPKEIMDVYYSNLMIEARSVLDLSKLGRIGTIDIRINQAYKGCMNFHFYTSINGLEEFHCKISKGDKPRNHFPGKTRRDLKLDPRCKWLTDFEINGVDVGKNKAQQKIDQLWEDRAQKEESKKRVKILVRELNELKRLQEKYNY